MLGRSSNLLGNKHVGAAAGFRRAAVFAGTWCCLTLVFSGSGLAQERDEAGVSERLERLEETVRNLDGKVSELVDLLRKALPDGPVTELAPVALNIENAPSKGSANASIALIEYSDFECPFCARHFRTAYRAIEEEFVATGRIKYVFRHLPLDQLHPHARKAAEAAECAQEQGSFWEFHDRLFEEQDALTFADLNDHVVSLGLDRERFQTCMDGGRATGTVVESVIEARQLGLTGTPAFVIGEVRGDGTVSVNRRLTGAHPYPVFKAALEDVLDRVTQR